MSETKQRRLVTGLKWAARVFGLAGVVFYLGSLLGSGLSSQAWIVVVGQISFAIGITLTVGGLIISRWEIRLAGILLTLSFVSPICSFIYMATKNHIDSSPFIFGVPSLVAGGLFLLSWWLSRKTSPQVLLSSPRGNGEKEKGVTMEERTQAAKHGRRQKRLRRAAIILGLIGAGAGVPWSLFTCVNNFQSKLSLEVGYLGFSWLIHWVILGIALAWPFVGGALLIIDGSLLVTFLCLEYTVELPGLILPNEWWILLLFISLLLLASGILFVLSWRGGNMEKSEQRGHADSEPGLY